MKTIYKAIADLQQEVPVIHKGTEGFNYSYADLPAIFEVINPLLKKYKLGFYQPLDGTRLKTIIFHTESEETIEGSVEIPQGVELGKMNDFQVLGSAITYLRRYSLASMLGLVTDKDTDAQGDQKKSAPKVSAEVAYQKASQAIKDCQSLEELEVIERQIEKSVNIPDRRSTEGKRMRDELGFMASERGDALKANEVPFP